MRNADCGMRIAEFGVMRIPRVKCRTRKYSNAEWEVWNDTNADFGMRNEVKQMRIAECGANSSADFGMQSSELIHS